MSTNDVNVRELELSNTDEVGYVDAGDDWDKIQGPRWRKLSNQGIAYTKPGGQTILLHRFLLDIVERPDLQVQFKDGNKLNCTRDNLVIIGKADHMRQVQTKAHAFTDTERGRRVVRREPSWDEIPQTEARSQRRVQGVPSISPVTEVHQATLVYPFIVIETPGKPIQKIQRSRIVQHEVAPDFRYVEVMIDVVESKPDAGMVGPIIYNFARKDGYDVESIVGQIEGTVTPRLDGIDTGKIKELEATNSQLVTRLEYLERENERLKEVEKVYQETRSLIDSIAKRR